MPTMARECLGQEVQARAGWHEMRPVGNYNEGEWGRGPVETKTAGGRRHPAGLEVTGRLIGNSTMPGAAAVEGGALSVV